MIYQPVISVKLFIRRYMSFVRSTERPEKALPPVKETSPPIQQPVLSEIQSVPTQTLVFDSLALALTAYPSQLATQYETWATQINAADPARAKILKDAAAALKQEPNTVEITLPHPSSPVNEIATAMKGIGGRKR